MSEQTRNLRESIICKDRKSNDFEDGTEGLELTRKFRVGPRLTGRAKETSNDPRTKDRIEGQDSGCVEVARVGV